MVVLFERKFVKEFHKTDDTIEARLRLEDACETAVGAEDDRHAEGDAVAGILKKPSERRHLVLRKERLAKEIGRKLYGDLANVFRAAFMLLPGVLQTSAKERQVVSSELLDVVADDAARPLAALDKVQFEFVVDMERISELRFLAVDEVEAILLAERRDFCDCVVHK